MGPAAAPWKKPRAASGLSPEHLVLAGAGRRAGAAAHSIKGLQQPYPRCPQCPTTTCRSCCT
jgi:hypothetical protein